MACSESASPVDYILVCSSSFYVICYIRELSCLTLALTRTTYCAVCRRQVALRLLCASRLGPARPGPAQLQHVPLIHRSAAR